MHRQHEVWLPLAFFFLIVTIFRKSGPLNFLAIIYHIASTRGAFREARKWDRRHSSPAILSVSIDPECELSH